MVNYYKYLPVSSEDEKWGISVLNTGCGRINAAEKYPLPTHPWHHNFNWVNGRVLQEYQVIYITKGQGVFECESCRETIIKEGTVIFLFPNEWHRYKPLEDTGWDEYWIGFKGEMAQNIMTSFFKKDTPFLHTGFNENLLNIFAEVIEKTKHEKAGYQPLVSGAVMYLLGRLHYISKQHSFTEADNIESIVSRARLILRENIDKDFSIEQISTELNVGYSWFRKIFKSYTGIAPGQYMIQLKIDKAKELLSDPSKTVKAVAYELKFDTCFYFSKLFKEKVGITPVQFRKKNLTN
ncbi:AraC family transcriptional regulator [soil metagenome]